MVSIKFQISTTAVTIFILAASLLAVSAVPIPAENDENDVIGKTLTLLTNTTYSNLVSPFPLSSANWTILPGLAEYMHEDRQVQYFIQPSKTLVTLNPN